MSLEPGSLERADAGICPHILINYLSLDIKRINPLDFVLVVEFVCL